MHQMESNHYKNFGKKLTKNNMYIKFFKKWICLDKTGIIVWTGTRNIYFIFKNMFKNGRYFITSSNTK